MILNSLMNRSMIAVDAICRRLKKKFGYKPVHGNNKLILIVFQQVFGDAVMMSSCLKEYCKLYPQSQGYQIKMLALPAICTFMKQVLLVPDEIELIPTDFKKFVMEYEYYKEIIQTYDGQPEILIVPGSSLSAEIFSTACRAGRNIGLVRSIPTIWPPYIALFGKLAYTEHVVPTTDLMMLQRHRKLLEYLGATHYKAQLPRLKPQERLIPHKYCAICLGSSTIVKCWPLKRYVEVMDYIIETYNLEIHLCGGADEIHFEAPVMAQTRYPQCVHSHIGRTTFQEWSAIIQHADLVLGNDSATMHLGAASRRKSVCIAGVYDKYQFFPYQVDELGEDERLPYTVYHDMPCELCRTRGYFSGYQNKQCRKAIRAGQCALCIEEITVDEVKNAVRTIMNQ